MHRIADINRQILGEIFSPTGLKIQQVSQDAPIPGSYWGAPEAGLIKQQLFVRSDTPVHSALHEASHYLCLTPSRRNTLHTDAGGTDDEESAVCYLQICLTDLLPEIDRNQLMADMDSWGYSFRLGTTRDWFTGDSEDARQLLIQWGLIDHRQRFQFCVRSSGVEHTDG